MQIDREVGQSHALVVDGNPLSRGVMMQHLRSFGFGHLKQASRIAEARDLLASHRFGLVVCDYHFDHSRETGQDLLDELRREQALPYATVFIMVTGEATYLKVAEAAEAALDSYLVKPFSANTLFERIKEARQRKRELKDIFDGIESGDNDLAIGLALQRFQKRQLYWLYAARVGAELLLGCRRTAEARSVYEAVVVAKGTPWARLGVARAQAAEGDIARARGTLEALLADVPDYADGHEVLGKLQMEQGLLDEALASCTLAATLTPDCVQRLQHCGALSFYAGDAAAATQLLERAWTTGGRSRLFDALSMMLLALLRFDGRDGRGLAQAEEVIARCAGEHPQSLRLRRMAMLCGALLALHEGRTDPALRAIREVAGEAARPDFDLEAATNLLSVTSRLAGQAYPAPEYAALVQQLARRYTVSKVAAEVLLAAVQKSRPAIDWIRDAQAQVMQLAEQAMHHAVRGEPRVAVEMLLQEGQATGNAKLIDMAGLVAQRHRDRIADVEPLLATAGTLAHRYCMPATHIAGVRRGQRSAGGLVLRR